ncbi:MAG: hypothetical protein AABM29_08305 [Actinomycetota bacterium]
MAFPRPLAIATASLAAALAVGACGGDEDAGSNTATTIPQPTQAQLAAAGLAKLPLAPESKRLDIAAPTFSNPTEITNPLFPVSDLHSVIFSGRVEGKAFHTETTLLPETRVIEWAPGQQVEARVSQYFAYIDGRIEEVALDYYAQADDGSVWYLGEDVNDYDVNGLVDSTEGTWLAGREGPPEMIMPADPQVGDVHRAENIPAIAFEEVAIKKINQTVPGPPGPVEGAMVARELHDDGTYSDKVFAPGYGEFFTAHGGEVEALALAVPTNALNGPVPPELETMSAEAKDIFDAARAANWKVATTSAKGASRAWATYRQGQVPPRLAAEMNRALNALGPAIQAHNRIQAGNAAIDVAQSTLDLDLRYRPPAEIDLARFELWARQVLVDAAAHDPGGVRGDVTTMEWVRDRFAHTIDPADLTRIDAHLVELRDTVANEVEDVAAAVDEAASLRSTIAGLESTA